MVPVAKAGLVYALFALWSGVSVFVGPAASIGAEPAAVAPPESPVIAEASAEAERAIAGFKVPEGWSTSVFAAEPMMANPVAFFINSVGDVYVCESFRQSAGVEDNRSHTYWVDDDLAAKTVEDRRAFILKHHADDVRRFTRQGERVRLLRDTNRDGRADRSTVFADGFNDVVSGSGAGVLQRGRDVYYACVPDLWLLNDQDGDGKADTKRSLFHGFGVHVAYKGHDLHGLTVGPDGKLYFTIGDRGYHVETAEGLVADPESGAVLRCNWDGSHLEVIHTGLRNPQELAFDDFGNLFVADNDSDSYDESRWIPIIDGGDSGWRMAFQYFTDRGPFFRENLWHPFHKEQAAYLAPTIAHVGSGPAGLAYYPGTGLSEHFQGRFLLCDFRGGAVNSGVDSFRLRPKGAFFELVDRERSIQGVLATDVDFGPDGAVYVSDWVHGWNGEGKGRIYRFVDPQHAEQPIVREVQRLLREGLEKKSVARLAELLRHADRRIRLESQFELVRRAETEILARVARTNKAQLARVHALWGLGQLVNASDGKNSRVLCAVRQVVNDLLGDADEEIRAQASRLAGDAGFTDFARTLACKLKDDSLRVRYFAAMSLSRLGTVDVLGPIIELLAQNADSDPMIRHAGIMCLARLGDEASLAAALRHTSSSVRLAAAVALRRRGDPKVAKLLADDEASVVNEAARAIHDVPIGGAMADLAALIDVDEIDEAAELNWETLRRVLNANFRIGGPVGGKRVAAVAACEKTPEHLRVEALKMLAAWATPSSRDRVLGMWRPIEPRSGRPAIDALVPVLAEVLSGSVRSEAARTAAALNLEQAVPVLEAIVRDVALRGQVRSDSLVTLSMYEDVAIEPLLQELVEDKDALVRIAARRVQAKIAPAKAVRSLEVGIAANDLHERQAAWQTLSTIDLPAADEAIVSGLRRLVSGDVAADTQLDVILAAEKRTVENIVEILAEYRGTKNPADEVAAKYRETLVGGRADLGREIFFRQRDVSCLRCHKVGGRGGAIGPDLSKIGSEKTREYLLESIVDPSRTIAKGFEPVLLVTEEGSVHAGIVESEDEQVVRLITPQGEHVDIEKSTIEERGVGLSAMPADVVEKLTRRDLRDLIEFLSSLRGS